MSIFRKLHILISQTTDSQFANYRFSFRKLQIFISFRSISFRSISFRFVSQSTVSRQELSSRKFNAFNVNKANKQPEKKQFLNYVVCPLRKKKNMPHSSRSIRRLYFTNLPHTKTCSKRKILASVIFLTYS